MNVNPEEISKFNELSDSWWDPSGESRALHDINACRGAFVAQTSLSGKAVLDVGCGGGILSEFLVTQGADVTGIDASDALISVARQHAAQGPLKIDYHSTTVEEFAEMHQRQFDVVTCMEMLEHVPDPGSVIEAIASTLKIGGSAYFSTLNRTPKSYALGIVAAEYILKLVPTGTHDYRSFIRPSELARWCRQANLRTDIQKGIHYNPFTHKAKLVTDLGVNYIVKTVID